MTTDEKILQSALTLFSQKGYSATSTRMIAQEAGVNEVTLFRHFGNKRGVYDRIISDLINIDSLMNFYANEITYDVAEDLTALSMHLLDVYNNNAQILKMIFMDDEQNHSDKKKSMAKLMPVREKMDEYFTQLYDMKKITDNPDNCKKFYFFNVVGYLMNVYVIHTHSIDMGYYNWMVQKTITAILQNSK